MTPDDRRVDDRTRTDGGADGAPTAAGLFPETLRTDRLRLERLDRSVGPRELYGLLGPDAPAVEEVTRYTLRSPFASLDDAREAVADAGDRWESGSRATYAVRPREGEDGAGDLAGTTNLAVDWDRRAAEPGILLARRFWGRGYSGERAEALVELAFDRLDLDLVGVTLTAGNERSRRAVARYVDRLGGSRDGRFRNALEHDDGSVHDAVRFTIRRSDWREAVDEPLRE